MSCNYYMELSYNVKFVSVFLCQKNHIYDHKKFKQKHCKDM